MGHFSFIIYSVVKSWVVEYNCGRSSVVDEHRSGRQNDAAGSVNIQIVESKTDE